MAVKLRKRYIVIAIVVVLCGVWIASGLFNDTEAIAVTTVNTTRANIESIVSTSGIVAAKETRDMYPEMSAKVTEVYAEKNDTVTKGQRIMELDLDNVTAQLSQLKIQRDLAQLKYNNLLTTNANGNTNVISIGNSVESLTQNYETNLALYELGAISKNDLDESKKRLDEAKAQQGEVSLNTDYSIEATKKEIELANINISTLEKQIKNLKELTVSPIDGVISALNISEGSYISAAIPAYTVVDNSEFEITVNVKEFTAKNIEVGQLVYITGDAFDGITYNGYIKSISPIATQNAMGQTYIEIIIGVSDKETKLSEGFNVTCDIVVNSKENVLSVPMSSFMEDEKGNRFVYTIENNKLKKIPVTTGINSEDELEIIDGLTDNMTIVNNVGTKYSEGMHVTVK